MLKSENYFLWQKRINFQIVKMSMSGNDLLEPASENTIPSKREQKKFQQLMKQIAASENADSKSHKKRRNPTEKKADPQARKLIKTESQISEGKNKEGSSSVKQQSEEESKSQQKSLKREIKDLHNVYNKKYGISEQSHGFSEYMVNYTYEQKSKYAQRQCEDWKALEDLGGKNIQIKCNETDQLLTQKFNSKLSGENDKVQELFSKNSKDFVKKIFQELFPKAPN